MVREGGIKRGEAHKFYYYHRSRTQDRTFVYKSHKNQLSI